MTTTEFDRIAYANGYDDGVHGRPATVAPNKQYQTGYRDGKADQEAADQPTLDELTYDPAMEATDPFGY